MMERRRSHRVPVSKDRFGRVKATVPARIVDISRHGVQLEVPAALRPAVECDLTLPFGTRDIRIRAKVHRCRAMGFSGEEGDQRLVYRAGLEFVAVAETDRDALFFLVDHLDDDVGAGDTGKRRTGPIKVKIDSSFIHGPKDEPG